MDDGSIKFAHKNPAPSIAENGEPGEEADLQSELKVSGRCKAW